ncbi:serine hydrolase domain-containing protein [Actinosynnema sp. NPDC047251]|uniref:Beta-lactamase, class C n=1 Tax=Saccharothrix espanaensis (strain ATCC 51144 / DSM 44229 / JCM 9112 / NBRC 15066 / NRRL 15764) TaxID=1179773 RepID=K0K285_SACES|nr:serine hydrolase domain-containing protein [Saccharothrix espanaensis]CCH30979.1 beta-lactamase, class C [Saccharothrix espanaensis DSM 44229]
MLPSILSALLLLSPTTAPATTPDPAAIDRVVEDYRAETGLPGAAVALTHGTTVVRAAGYGRTADGEAVTEHTTMAVASVSKSFTALAVMQLVDAGRVRLDDPVRDHLPEFAPADPRAGRITVRHLLDQTSGLSDTTFRPFSGREVATLRDAVASMRDATLASEPGTRWAYHNPNFQVAARLVEVVAGEPFADYLRRHVFEPLGMADSATADTERDLPASARGHVHVLGAAVPVPEPPAFGNGSGGVLSSAHDLAAWLVAQNTGTPIASPESIAATHTRSAGSYGLGWFVGTTDAGAPLVDHGGDLFTSTAYQALLPASGHGIAVMANTGTQYGDAQALGERLIALLEGRPFAPAPGSYRVVDIVLVTLAAGVVALAVRGVARARRHARRSWLRLLPLLLPVLLAATIHRVAGFLYRGRDVSWRQVAYLYPTFMVLLVVTATACVVVLAARLLARRRPPQGFGIDTAV